MADVELILMKQVASALAMPILLVASDGTLLFYNEPAEALLGERYDETGEISYAEWAQLFKPMDRSGRQLSSDETTLGRAMRGNRPTHGEISLAGLDGVRRDLSVTAFPLVGQNDRHLGFVVLFWEYTGA